MIIRPLRDASEFYPRCLQELNEQWKLAWQSWFPHLFEAVLVAIKLKAK